MSAPAAEYEKRLEEIQDHAGDAINGIRALKGFLSTIDGKFDGLKIDQAACSIRWMVDKLHMDLDRIHDLTNLACEPLPCDREIDAEAAS